MSYLKKVNKSYLEIHTLTFIWISTMVFLWGLKNLCDSLTRLSRDYWETAQILHKHWPRTAQGLLRDYPDFGQGLFRDCQESMIGLPIKFSQFVVENNKYLSLMTQYLLRPDYMNNIDRVLSVAVQVREKFCSRKKTKWKIYGGKEYTLL